MSLLAELKRRHVLKVSAAYVVVAWIAVQVASIAFPAFEAPAWALRVFILVLALGFPLTVILAWMLELTPEGVRVDSAPLGNKRVFGVAAALAALAIAWYTIGQPALRNDGATPPAAAATAAPSPPAAPATPQRSIAVMPFVDMSQDKDQEYFSDGITEEILNALTRIEGLKVAGRTSSFHFKGRNENLQTIGAALGVAHVLEGSVRKQGDRIRITAQLIKVDDGFHLWSENYDRKLDDIFAVQDEISAAIATALSSKLAAGGGDKGGSEIDPQSYDIYLRARQALALRTAERIAEAARLFAEVNAREPGFDAAWSGRAKSLALLFNYTGAVDVGKIEEARKAGERALALNPGNAEALIMLAFNDVLFGWRFEEALKKARAAIAAAPNDAEVANFAGDVFRFTGELDEALQWEKRAVELDPLFDVNHTDYGYSLAMRGRYQDALDSGARALRLDPTFWSANDMRARALLGMGEPARAQAEIEQLAKSYAGSAQELELRARVAIAQGKPELARTHLVELQRLGRAGETVDYLIAIVQAKLGDFAQATRSLERALAARDPNLVGDPEFMHPQSWPDEPAIRAVFARPELAPIMPRRARYAAESRPVTAP